MSDEAADLNSEDKAVRRRLTPVNESLLRRQMIEAVIKFHSGEVLSIEFQPLRFSQLLRIKKPPPVLIIPAAGSNVVLSHRYPNWTLKSLPQYNQPLMEEANKESRLPIVAPIQVINRGFTWINTRRSFIKVRKFSGISSILMLPVFILGLLFLALIIVLLLTLFLLYVIFYFLIALPKLNKTSKPL